jgi:biotin transport system substrate-specific component
MWISGRISFEIPALSVPITLQSMVAILLPLCLIGRYASGGILIWLILGALGLPFFADGNGGYQYFYSNSGGYLLGF